MKLLMENFLLIYIFLQLFYIVNTNAQNAANLFYGSSLAVQNPIISMNCFSDYISKSREISEGYSKDYNNCLLEAKADRQTTDDQMLDKRLAIVESSHGICMRLSICDKLDTTLEIFHCHALIGANNTKDVYSISGNASEYASILQENYRQIDLRHEQCSKISERKYVAATGVNYRRLQNCLDGRIKPSSSSPSATTATTLATILTTPKDDSHNNDSTPLGITEIEVYPESLDTTTLESGGLTNTTL